MTFAKTFIRHILCLSLALLILLSSIPAQADDGYASGTTLLRSLTHNCPNTGIMLPETFNPYQTTYLLTVASWVSRPTFTPVAMDPGASIYVNGQYVCSGETSQVIPMTDTPQAVTIQVSNGTGSTTYTIYLQRRPSERDVTKAKIFMAELIEDYFLTMTGDPRPPYSVYTSIC